MVTRNRAWIKPTALILSYCTTDQDRRMQGVQQHQQQQKGFREVSPLRGSMNGPSSGLSVSMASGSAAPAPFSRSSSGPTSLSSSSKSHGLSAVGNVGAQVQSELGGVGSRGSSPHRPRMYPAEPPGLSAGGGRYGFVDGVSGGGVLSRGEGSIHRSMSHGAGVQGGFGRPPRQQQQQQQVEILCCDDVIHILSSRCERSPTSLVFGCEVPRLIHSFLIK